MNDHSVYLPNGHYWFFQSQDTCFVNLCSSDILRVCGLLRPRWKKSVYCSSTATWGHQGFYSIHSLLHSSMEIYPTKPPSQKQNTKAIIVLPVWLSPPCALFLFITSPEFVSDTLNHCQMFLLVFWTLISWRVYLCVHLRARFPAIARDCVFGSTYVFVLAGR